MLFFLPQQLSARTSRPSWHLCRAPAGRPRFCCRAYSGWSGPPVQLLVEPSLRVGHSLTHTHASHIRCIRKSWDTMLITFCRKVPVPEPSMGPASIFWPGPIALPTGSCRQRISSVRRRRRSDLGGPSAWMGGGTSPVGSICSAILLLLNIGRGWAQPRPHQTDLTTHMLKPFILSM